MKKYEDKNGKIIVIGNVIKHDSGDTENVYGCGDCDLGVNASNEAYLKRNPEAKREFYPLSQFDLSEWEIIE